MRKILLTSAFFAPLFFGAAHAQAPVVGPCYNGVSCDLGTGALTAGAVNRVVSVIGYGADPTGVTDSEPAFAAAIAALPASGGTVYAPAGTYYFAETLPVTTSNITIEGASLNGTTIQGALSLASVVQVGNSTAAPLYVKISNLTVSRQSGTPPTGSISLYWSNFGYGYESNVMAENSYYGRAIDDISGSGVSIGYHAIYTHAANVTRAYAHINNAADVFFDNTEWGQNGGELYNPVYAVEISGGANDVNFNNGVIIPRSPTANSATLVGFTGYTNTTGIIRFKGITSENVAYAFASDLNTPQITDLDVVGSRISTGTAFFNLYSGTLLEQSNVAASDIGGGALNLGHVQWVRVTSSFLAAFSAAGTTTSDDLTVVGNTIGNTTISGTFGSLVFSANDVESGSTFSDTATATTKFVQNPNGIQSSAATVGIGTTNGTQLSVVDPGATTAVSVSVEGAASGGGPLVSVSGGTNNPLRLSAAGANSVLLQGNGGTTNSFSASSPSGAVNYLFTTANTTGASPLLGAGGSDTNVSMRLQAQGAGTVLFLNPAQLSVATVATLPTCGTALKGGWMAVSDAVSPTYNGALTGGGTVGVTVYCNGTAWTSQ